MILCAHSLIVIIHTGKNLKQKEECISTVQKMDQHVQTGCNSCMKRRQAICVCLRSVGAANGFAERFY